MNYTQKQNKYCVHHTIIIRKRTRDLWLTNQESDSLSSCFAILSLFQIFFVLRKKQNQVTFLHIYHHTGMVIVSWGIVKWLPGMFNNFINSIRIQYF